MIPPPPVLTRPGPRAIRDGSRHPGVVLLTLIFLVVVVPMFMAWRLLRWICRMAFWAGVGR